MAQTINEQIEKVNKDLRKIKNRLWGAARKYGNESFGLDYENAAGYIEFAIADVKTAKLNLKLAERQKIKCES